jgi:hypothetical protein
MHRSRVAAKGQRPIVFPVEGLRRALYAIGNCGIQVQQFLVRNTEDLAKSIAAAPPPSTGG